MITFDHFAIAAGTLEQGVAYVAARTGLKIPPGGEHDLMGTHNHLMSTGKDTFLEVIAINPAAPLPARKRWFALSDPTVQAALNANAKPHSWVLRSDDLDRDLKIAREMGIDLGQALTVTRGALTWRFAVREDGMIPLDGSAPMLMQWGDMPAHPAASMTDLGARFRAVNIHTPHAQMILDMLDAIGGDYTPVTIHESEHVRLTADLALEGKAHVQLT